MINPVALITVTETGVVYSTERGELLHVTSLAARELHIEEGFPNTDRYPDTDDQAYFALGFDEDFYIQESDIARVQWLTTPNDNQILSSG